MVPNYREIIIFGDAERFNADALLNIKRTLNTMSAADKTIEPFDVIVRYYDDTEALARGLMPDEKVDAVISPYDITDKTFRNGIQLLEFVKFVLNGDCKTVLYFPSDIEVIDDETCEKIDRAEIDYAMNIDKDEQFWSKVYGCLKREYTKV